MQSTQQHRKRIRAYNQHVCDPNGIYSVHFEKACGLSSKKNGREAAAVGSYSNYLLEGCFHQPLHQVILEYLDLLGPLWEALIACQSMQTEGTKRSRDSVVSIRDSDAYWAGGVRFCLSHTPPGRQHGNASMALIAHD